MMPQKTHPFSLDSTYVVLGEDGTAIPVPVSSTFFDDLGRQFGSFQGKRLVSHFTFDQDWDTWEMHPAGEEFVCLLSGQVDVVLEHDGAEHRVHLNSSGAYVLVPRSTWHTARVYAPSAMLFITPGEGTQHRPV
ncbi:hypothetical protein XM38_032270 [Halomicronema hongdechloris C2206]|uniref:Sugar 3,4-ketoisomerase QdtA cupin domain-containing protein n=1 Tax=Halomicronema hongdechloris C2206 TaxID=1641165 RepID=A0A1Z3HPP1_9CYAN|nr:WxcM-like domain-containing protein [Halomicronema hongdechloris]ASC72271.1 hypothetical protein XM38_032270 [Halomicronema hongdechloris C2206]